MIKILFLAANPKDTDSLRLGEEMREIKERLRLAKLRDEFFVEQEWAVRVSDLEEHLLRHEPHLVHFSGHGSKSGEIILEDSSGNGKPVPPNVLKRLFAVLKDNVRCIVLNACYSEIQAEALVASIDCVVGMTRAIPDRAAINFASSFYQGLGFGRSIQEAFELGCVQVQLENSTGATIRDFVVDSITSQEGDIPRIKVAPGVDASKLYLVRTRGTSTAAMTGNKPKATGLSVPSDETENPAGRYSCFISYSSKDEEFAQKLHSRLKAEGVDIWFAPEDVQAGKKLHEQIGKAIEDRDKLLLVLSEHSMGSEWVATEIRKARKAEIKEGGQKLFPIRLVDFATIRDWECFDADNGKDLGVEVREYFIPDFSHWKEHDSFEVAFARLLKDLEAE